jgi:SAM-dependent methyltransferase
MATEDSERLDGRGYSAGMSFNVAADAYDRFMGRYSSILSPQMADLAGVAAGQRVLDVGCGPGALTAVLVKRVGAAAVAAVDPSEPFVAAARERFPGSDVRLGSAEGLPFDDATFDASLAQLVVHFMADPVQGLGEMRRVTRPGGVVAACVWDHAGERGPLGAFWRAARELDPTVVDESQLAGARRGHLGELFRAAGLTNVEDSAISADLEHASFEEWWAPYTGGVGPAGAYVARLTPETRERLRARCEVLLGPPPFTIEALAWTARGIV